MARQKVGDEELLDRLSEVFRSYGFEAASLTRIVAESGLERASLYHRFPGGKEEMACAVLDRASECFKTHILTPLSDQGDPAARVKEMARRINRYYTSGRRSCLLDSLSLGGGSDVVQTRVAEAFKAWLDALIKISREAGLPASQAKLRGEEALIRIQGALVMSRAMRTTKPFSRVLDGLPSLLTESA